MLLDRILEEFEQRVIIPLLAVLLAFITIGVFIQVVLRYVFSTSFLWGEELSLFAFIWCVFLGARCRRPAAHAFRLRLSRPTCSPAAAADAQRLVINLSILLVAAAVADRGLELLAAQHPAHVAGAGHHAVHPDARHPDQRRPHDAVVVLSDRSRDCPPALRRPERLMHPLAAAVR